MINPVVENALQKYGTSEGNFSPEERWMWDLVKEFSQVSLIWNMMT